MTGERMLNASERWFRLLLHLYPADFREEMGAALVETYRDRCRAALRQGGTASLFLVWLRALADSVVNGLAERARPAIAWRRSGNWGRDMEGVVRRLSRAPLFALTVIGTLTIGLGAFATVYAVVDKVLLDPLPYEDPDDLYFVWRNYTWMSLDRGWLGGTDVAALDTAGGVIEGAVGLRRVTRTLTQAAGGEPVEVGVMISSPELFRLLGTQPALGRGFSPDESGPDRPGVVVLGHDLWANRFGADSTILGAEVRLSELPFTVIGVMGPDFRFVRHSSLGPPEGADAYITFDYNLAETDPGGGAFAGLLRAQPGASPEAVASTVQALGIYIDERDFDGRGVRLYPVSAKEDLIAGVRPALLVLSMAGLFLVLVLTVNLATLLLARAAQREREFAISRALGGNPLALARAMLFEGGLLGLMGAMGGVLVAWWGTRVLLSLAPLDLPRRDAVSVDPGIALVVVITGTALGLLAGVLPASWATRANLTSLLSNASVRGGGGGHGNLRRSLVVVQVALSLVLLSTGGLVVKSFGQLLRSQPGFVPTGVLTLRVPVPIARYPEEAQGIALHQRLQAELASLPGVASVGATNSLPLTANANQNGVALPGAPGNTGDEDHDMPLVDMITVRPGLFEALSIPILAGRDFEPVRPPGPPEAVIDRTLAAEFFPSGSPIGATLRMGDDTLTVVGVVEHARQYDLHVDGRSQVFVRNDDFTDATLTWVIRTTRDPASLIPEVRAAIRRADAALAIADMRPMDRVVDESLRQQRLSATLVTGFSLGALLLAAMGLFGIVSGAVARRRHELAVRMALGAHHQSVIRLVLREGALLIGIGLLLGVPGILFAGRVLAGTLVGVSPFDPAILLAVAGGLALVTLAACYIPARRVTGIEPASALRQE